MDKQKAAVVMQTDFTKDISVCTMQGVCMMVDPELKVFDSTHDMNCFDTYQASTSLSFVVDFWPAGTVFVSVVDPGVGTSRCACVAKLSNGSYVVTPDNGSLTHVKEYFGIDEVRVIDETKHRLQKTGKCNIFHGRDLFAYCVAKLASGIINFEQVGKKYPLEEMVLHAIKGAEVAQKYVKATIQGYDPFGSAELSVLNAEFQKTGFAIGDKLKIKITTEDMVVFDEIVCYEKSFGYVEKGENVIFNDLASYVTIACNACMFAETYHLDPEKTYIVEISEA